MQADVDGILIDRQAIERRVSEVARTIAADLSVATESAPATELTLVPILTGSIIFVSDLIRKLPLRMRIHLISVSSYPGPMTTSRGARIRAELTCLPDSLSGAHVLVVDDILDSGNTLSLVLDVIKQKRAASIRTCVLLRKQRPEAMRHPCDYVCFDIPDQFVVGYGLDFNGYYRNLPDIMTCHPKTLGKAEDQGIRVANADPCNRQNAR